MASENELIIEIHSVQSYLYSEYKLKRVTNLEWLNELCAKVKTLFTVLQKFIHGIKSEINKPIIMNNSFLIASQIVKCIKLGSEIVKWEEQNANCLITGRQCFFERLLWCLARLRSVSKSANDQIICDPLNECENFISLLDSTLDDLSSFVSLENEQNITNKAERRADLMMVSREIKEKVERLISFVLTFSNSALDADKIPLHTLSQNAFRAAVEFSDEFSLSKPYSKERIVSQRMKAIELENSLYSLENFINDALLKLVYETFREMNLDPVDELGKTKDPNVLNQKIEKFDDLMEKLLQIGHFAVWFSTDDIKTSSDVRSCLASLESLDSYLIPAITKNDPSIDVLEAHFNAESNELVYSIHKIIDTKAFCTSLIDQLLEIDEMCRKKFNKTSLEIMLARAKVLNTHLQINSDALKLSQDKATKFYYHDFKLMVSECEAILNYPEKIDDCEKRTLKRFNILKNTIKKLLSAIKVTQGDRSESENQKSLASIDKISEISSRKCSNYFDTIRPSKLGSILYESKRSIKHHKNELTKLSISTIRKPASKNKRNSLRTAIFKKNQDNEVREIEKVNNETFDLEITEILERLSHLSTTLS